MKKLFILISLGALNFILFSAQVTANPIFFVGTGHYYEVFLAPGTTWAEAKAGAESHSYLGIQGHLVTISSAAENTFVFDTFILPTNANWLGGFQDENASAPDEGWHWVTGEPFSYTNWNPRGEPNDGGPVNDEDRLHMPPQDGGFWNDVKSLGYTNFTDGYVVEYGIDGGMQPVIPEPSTFALLGLGLGGLAIGYRRKKTP